MARRAILLSKDKAVICRKKMLLTPGVLAVEAIVFACNG